MGNAMLAPKTYPLNTEQYNHSFTVDPSRDRYDFNWWDIQTRYTETHHYGTAGDDQMTAASPDLNVFYAGKGSDYAVGSVGRDVIYMEQGGDNGCNTMMGGAGRDTFSWAFCLGNTPASNEIDIVYDFTLGEDKLAFTPLLNQGGQDLQLSLRQMGSSGILELRNSSAELVRTIELCNTDLLSVIDGNGMSTQTLSSQEALQRMTDMGALSYSL